MAAPFARAVVALAAASCVAHLSKVAMRVAGLRCADAVARRIDDMRAVAAVLMLVLGALTCLMLVFWP